MLIHINQRIKEIHGIYSLEGLKATFILPEVYHALTLADFVEHRREIQPTKKRFSSVQRVLQNEAAVIINSAYYQQSRLLSNICEEVSRQSCCESGRSNLIK